MKCDEVRSLLPEHASGGLPDPLGLGVETHLAGCPACLAEYQALRKVCQALDAAPAPVVQLDPGVVREEALRRERRRARRWRRAALAAAAAAVLLAGLALLPRLEVRFEGHQFVVRWGAEPQKSVAPAPPAPPEDDRLRQLETLVQALAADVQGRDLQRLQELLALQEQIDRLRQEAARLRVSTEQDVSTLTRFLEQTLKDKGDMR
jgi:anti-sigma factor RsiW